ncbi:MAG TPA: SDR family oxidoreductase [Saprospiraceae bacterium]|nr:SDR family oxidoreductase [Saprospiraceae bacterium]
MPEKVVLVTGASSGLGKALAEYLHRNGYKVYGTSRRPVSSTPFSMLVLDVTSSESVDAAVAELLQREGRIDILVNNAGIGLAGPLEHLQMTNVKNVFDTNVFGVLRVCQAVLPAMRKQGNGRIFNIGSIGGEFGLPFRGMYSATKAALGIISDAMRFETGRFGVQTTTILAGDMQTAINDHRIKDYRPGDEAYAAVFEKVYAAMDQHVDHGLPAEEAARRIERLFRVPKLKSRYAVGPGSQVLSVLLKKILPASWMERILAGYAKV